MVKSVVPRHTKGENWFAELCAPVGDTLTASPAFDSVPRVSNLIDMKQDGYFPVNLNLKW